MNSMENVVPRSSSGPLQGSANLLWAKVKSSDKMPFIVGSIALLLASLMTILSFSGVIFAGIPFLGATIGIAVLLSGVVFVLAHTVVNAKKQEQKLQNENVELVKENIRLEKELLEERGKSFVFETSLQKSIDQMNALTNIHRM